MLHKLFTKSMTIRQKLMNHKLFSNDTQGHIAVVLLGCGAFGGVVGFASSAPYMMSLSSTSILTSKPKWSDVAKFTVMNTVSYSTGAFMTMMVPIACMYVTAATFPVSPIVLLGTLGRYDLKMKSDEFASCFKG